MDKTINSIVSNRILFLVMVMAALFLVCQSLLVETGWTGGLCTRTLTGPNEDDHPMISWRSRGVPFEFFRITEEGCFEQRVSHTDFQLIPLLADLGIFALLFALAIIVLRLVRRAS